MVDPARASGDEPHPDSAPSEFHRRLMAQEEGLAQASSDPASSSCDVALALAQELHNLGALLERASEPGPAPGRRWGRFEILHPLGRGGLSEVYLARDEKLGRRVALKRLRPHTSLDERTRRWLANEGQSLARLQHPGVVGVLDLDTAGEDPLLVMEYVEGAPLSAVLAHLRGEPSDDPHVRAAAVVLEPVAARVDLAQKVASALAHCHRSGVLHRDMKPSNVVVDLAFRPRLIDFGLAHLDASVGAEAPSNLTEQLVGTPAYFAPEQIDATRIGADPRSDQFSFGVLLYELLSGKQPFARATREATLQAVGRAEFEPLSTAAPELAPELDWIAQRCLEREPQARYPCMEEVAADLDAFLHYRAVSAAPPSLIRQARRVLQRHASALAWLTLAVGSSALMLASLWISNAREARAQAQTELERVRAGLAGYVDPAEYQEALFRLSDIARTEAARDARLAGLVAPGQATLIDLVGAALADELLTRVEFERAEGRQRLREFELARWRGPLNTLARLRPGDARITAELDRERVFAPQLEGVEHRLERWTPPPPGGESVRVAAPWSSDPGQGRYRWTARDQASGALLAEREFRIESDGDPLRLELTAASAFEWEFALVEVPPKAAEQDSPAPTSPALVNIGLRVIRWVDLEAVLTAEEGPGAQWRVCRVAARRRSEADAAPEAPALVPHSVAEAFAFRAGARLPTRGELATALAQQSIERAADPVALEWLGDLGRMSGNSGTLAYSTPAERLEFPTDARFCASSSGAHIAFRLARSAH